MASPFRPDSWPLATRTAVDLLVAAVLPLIVGVTLVSARGRAALEAEAQHNLRLVAQVVATQVDQLLADAQGRLTQVAEDERVVRFCRGDGVDRETLFEPIQLQVRRVRRDDPDIGSIFLTDADGIGINSTHDHNIGQDLTFREYWREGRAGRRHMSGLLVGTRSREAGIYFSAPVVDGEEIVGVAVLKLDGRRLQQIIDSVDVPGGEAALSDAAGIVLVHQIRERAYHSFGPLDDETRAQIDPALTFGIDRIDHIGLPDLMEPLRSGRTGAVVHRRTAEPDGSARWVIGHAPLAVRDWMASVSIPMVNFEAPMAAMRRQQIAMALVLVCAAGVYAWFRGPRLVRPILTLTRAAGRIADGDLDARVPDERGDEIGALGSAFNAMTPHLRERTELRHSLSVASEMQRALLPIADPTIPGLEICGRSRPCDETGGDYYDYIDIAQIRGGLLVAVGDVVGHGIGSALVMASARGALRAAVADHDDPAAVMTTLNAIVAHDSRDGRFMTLLLMRIDREPARLRWVSAGHDPALLLTPDSDEITELEGSSMPLGVIADDVYEVFSAPLPPPGSILFLGTDGIWEARSETDEMYGKARLHDLLRNQRDATAAEIGAALEADLATFTGTRRLEDDVTFVVVRFDPPQSSTTRTGESS